jgi:hypothetical protein
MKASTPLSVYIDPSSNDFLQNRLFDAADPRLNRDGTLLPFVRLKQELASKGVSVHTADCLGSQGRKDQLNHYWSIGILNSYQKYLDRSDVVLRGFMLFEPPLVAPAMYEALPSLTKHFQEVFLHNTTGEGYSLKGVDKGRLRKFYWPQPYDDVVEPYWSTRDRLNKLVVIAGSHNPRGRQPELYSHRIRAIAELERLECIDLFGRGWPRWWSRDAMWLPYWLNRRALMRAYRGSCESKLETLGRYRFSVCLENMPMDGYITEKIFDCFYAGCVPIYKGGNPAGRHLPANTYIDANAYGSWAQLWNNIKNMPAVEWETYRDNARAFLQSQLGRAYFNSLTYIVGNAIRPEMSPRQGHTDTVQQ